MRGDLPVARLAAYAGPALPLAALTLPLYVILPTFYAETIGLPLAQVGFILLAVRLIDALSDPVVGVLSDRFHPPLGRRRGWFLAASLPAALAAYMILTPPEDATGLYLLGWGIALSLGYTACVIPYTAWGADLVSDYHGRSRIAGAREGMVLVGTLLAVSVPGIAEALGAKGQALSLQVLALFVVVALPVLTLIAVWRLPEPATPAVHHRPCVPALHMCAPIGRSFACWPPSCSTASPMVFPPRSSCSSWPAFWRRRKCRGRSCFSISCAGSPACPCGSP